MSDSFDPKELVNRSDSKNEADIPLASFLVCSANFNRYFSRRGMSISSLVHVSLCKSMQHYGNY